MQSLLSTLLLIGIVFATFAGSTQHTFLSSDRELLLEAGEINPPRMSKVVTAWTDFEGPIFDPLPTAIWIATARVSGDIGKARSPQDPIELDPAPFHLLNVVFHLLATLMVFNILHLLLQNGFGAFFGAALFAVHPLQVESVAWISNFNLVCGVFLALFATWRFLIWTQKREGAQRGAKPIRHYYVATIAYLLALLSHPVVLCTPFVVAVLERVAPSSRSSLLRTNKPLWPTIAWAIIGLPIAIFTIAHQQTGSLSEQVNLWMRPFIAGDAVAFYLYKLLLPLGLGPDYGRTPFVVMQQWWGYVTWLVPITLCFVLMYWREKPRTWFASAAAAFGFALLPFLGFIVFEAQSNSTVADRYLYFAMIGPALAMAYLVSMKKKPAFAFIAFLAICTAFYLSKRQLKIWEHDQSLWEYALHANPDSSVAHRLLADASLERGDFATAKVHYGKVLETNKTDPVPLFNLAEIHLQEANYTEAEAALQRVLKLDPSFDAAYYKLGLAEYQQNDFAAALTHFQKASSKLPRESRARYYIGRTYLETKDYTNAIETLKSVVNDATTSAEVLEEAKAYLGLAHYLKGDVEESRDLLAQVSGVETPLPMVNKILGDIYFGEGSFEDALKHYERYTKQNVGEIEADVLGNLAIIYISQEKFNEAASQLTRAIEKRPDRGDFHQNLGIAHFNLRQFEAATTELELALQLDNRLADPFYYLGDIQRWRGQNDQAVAYYYKALRIDPKHAKSNYRLGHHFLSQDKPQQALNYFRMALKSDPEDKRIASSLRRAESRVSDRKM